MLCTNIGVPKLFCPVIIRTQFTNFIFHMSVNYIEICGEKQRWQNFDSFQAVSAFDNDFMFSLKDHIFILFLLWYYTWKEEAVVIWLLISLAISAIVLSLLVFVQIVRKWITTGKQGVAYLMVWQHNGTAYWLSFLCSLLSPQVRIPSISNTVIQYYISEGNSRKHTINGFFCRFPKKLQTDYGISKEKMYRSRLGTGNG